MPKKKTVTILGIETSCDETAIAVVECSGGIASPKFKILSNIVSSQVKLHAKWGGVVPNLAKREHIKNLPLVLKKALAKAGRGALAKIIDVIAVTAGPGLEPALWAGVSFAAGLSEAYGKPMVAANHMEGHLVSPLLAQNRKNPEFPALALLVSGGHTELALVKKWGDYRLIGQTLDDAAGEAFDKVARMLGLGYPGGPEIYKLAAHKKTSGMVRLPRPMINSKNYDFSFSGLKTAVLYLIRDLKCAPARRRKSIKQFAPAIAREFQQAVIDVLASKTTRAAKEYKVKSVLLGGGVAANKELAKQLARALKPLFLFRPPAKFTGDNAAMIAAASYFSAVDKKFVSAKKLEADAHKAL